MPDDITPPNPASEATESLSKSARKREAERLQIIGLRLCQLSTEQLETLQLPASLHTALLDYQRFPSRGAKRRQLQFIGKLMRAIDPADIEDQLATLEGESAQARYRFNQLEQWRDRLIEEDDAVTEFIASYPLVNRQQLRQLVKKTAGTQNPQQRKILARQLFRFLREAMAANNT